MTNSSRDDRPDTSLRSIADPYWDLLAKLDEARRLGMVRRLAVGFYEGWIPSRAEVAILVDFELGRVTEDEFFASKQSGPPEQRDTLSANHSPSVHAGSTDLRAPDRRVGGDSGVQARRKAGKPLAAFNVDCGELAPPFRFIANRLSGAGWTLREGKQYQLMALHYELIPPTRVPTGQRSKVTPVLFSAPILCVPDVAAPWSNDDGARRQHAVGTHRVTGSRGLWPVADEAQRVSFVITRQSAPGSRPAARPAGTLRVDLSRGIAVWRGNTGAVPT